jgi:hypothetical protein
MDVVCFTPEPVLSSDNFEFKTLYSGHSYRENFRNIGMSEATVVRDTRTPQSFWVQSLPLLWPSAHVPSLSLTHTLPFFFFSV